MNAAVTSAPAQRPHAPHVGGSVAQRNHPLDGIRGIGTIFVLFGHLGIGIFTGLRGVLAVAMFFTLSGYLIATGLLKEMNRSGGRVDMRAFYVRRARRLLPMATLVVGAVAVAWLVTDRRLRYSDVIASLTYWQNWNLIRLSADYGAIFGSASPLQHYWSLSIEEQFYLLLPACLLGVTWLARGHRAVVMSLLTVVTVGLVLLGGSRAAESQSRAYYGTDVRAGEFLAGVVVAYALATGPGQRLRGVFARPSWAFVATVVLVLQMAAWWHVGFADSSLFPGWIAFNILCTIVLITSATHATPGNRFLSTRPLVLVGRASYSIYLIHWPFFLLVPAGLPMVVEGTVKIAGALLIGLLLFAVVEEPVRIGQRWIGWRLPLALTAAFVLAVAIAVPASRAATDELVDQQAINDSQTDFFEDLTTVPAVTTGPTVPQPSSTPTPSSAPSTQIPPATGTTPATATTEPTTTVPVAPVSRVMYVGDSNSFTSTLGIDANRADLPWDWKLWSGTQCGASAGDVRMRSAGEVHDGFCESWIGDLPAAVDAYRPDLVVVTSLGGDLSEFDLGDGVWRHIGDPTLDPWLRGNLERFLAILTSTGARVAWQTMPPYAVANPGTETIDTSWPLNDPVNVDRMNAMVRDLAASHPEMTVVDFAAWADTWPNGPLDTTYRPDGAHVDGNLPDVIQWWLDVVDSFQPRT